MNNNLKSEIMNRISEKTPKFFRILRNIGLGLAAVSAAVIASPVALPVAIVTAAGYVGLAGGVMSAVSQLTKEKETEE